MEECVVWGLVFFCFLLFSQLPNRAFVALGFLLFGSFS